VIEPMTLWGKIETLSRHWRKKLAYEAQIV
jgi:hypothetical protein